MIRNISDAKKELERREKELRDRTANILVCHGEDMFSDGVSEARYICATVASKLDTTALKKAHPDICAKFTTTTEKAGYLRISDVKVAVKDLEQ